MENQYGPDHVYWFDEHFQPFDGLETAETVERATWYGITEWPYVRVDGSAVFIGIYNCHATAAHLSQLIDARLQETGGMSPVRIDGDFQADNNVLQFRNTFRLIDPVVLTDLRATFVAIEDNVTNGFGTFPRVTRAIRYEPVTLANQGDSVSFNITIPRDPNWNPDHLRAIVFLQQTSGNKPIIQGLVRGNLLATGVPLPGEFAQPLSRIEGINPNPFRETTTIHLSLSGAAVSGNIRLEIFDLNGRMVRRLLDGATEDGSHAWTWDGLGDGGRHLESGVYFARLLTRDGESRRKLIMLR